MKNNYFLVGVALFISLFIYLFFRTEHTVVTQLFISMVSLENYISLKEIILKNLYLPPFVIYSVPEGLWVFTATVMSKGIIYKEKNFELDCSYLPLIFSIGLEFLQLIHVTHGMFDFFDIWVSIFFWTIANFYLDYSLEIGRRKIYFFSSYAIVYLSYVPNH